MKHNRRNTSSPPKGSKRANKRGSSQSAKARQSSGDDRHLVDLEDAERILDLEDRFVLFWERYKFVIQVALVALIFALVSVQLYRFWQAEKTDRLQQLYLKTDSLQDDLDNLSDRLRLLRLSEEVEADLKKRPPPSILTSRKEELRLTELEERVSQGQLEEFLDQLKQAKSSPLAGLSLLREADKAVREGHHKTAFKLYMQSVPFLKSTPLYARASLAAALSALELGRTEAAEAALEAIAANQTSLQTYRAAAAYYRARSAIKKKDYEKAAQYLKLVSTLPYAGGFWQQRAYSLGEGLPKLPSPEQEPESGKEPEN